MHASMVCFEIALKERGGSVGVWERRFECNNIPSLTHTHVSRVRQ